MEDEDSDFFLNRKPVRALVKIRKSREDPHISEIARKVDTTYAHQVKIISWLNEEGYLETEKLGRKKILFLTDEGKVLADRFISVLEFFEGKGESISSSIQEGKMQKIPG